MYCKLYLRYFFKYQYRNEIRIFLSTPENAHSILINMLLTLIKPLSDK